MLRQAAENGYIREYLDESFQANTLPEKHPEIYLLRTALENPKYHPEGNAFEHTMLVMDQCYKHGYHDVAMACLFHDIGKAFTPRKYLPKHYGHDKKGADRMSQVFRNCGVDENDDLLDGCYCAARYHMYFHKLNTLRPITILRMLNDVGHHANTILKVAECDAKGRLGSENYDFAPTADLFSQYVDAYNSEVDDNAKMQAIAEVKRSYQ